MIEPHPFASLGAFRNEWLDSKHHFSFGQYRDPARMGLGKLRVWNDDEIAAGTGFDPHPHRDMEIITYVFEGAITHRDSLGNEGRTVAGDVQVMHAGTGITHAEYNREPGPTRLFQIWIIPDRMGVTPGWATRQFPREGAGLTILASGRPQDSGTDALPLNANAALLSGTIPAGETVRYHVAPGRAAYLVPASGRLTVNGKPVNTRDGLAITANTILEIHADETAELVLADVSA